MFNIGTLTPEELAKSVKLEEHVQILDDYLATQQGDYGWMGADSQTVPKAAFDGMTGRAERAARVRARMAKGEPPLMISYDTLTQSPMFAEEDKEAFDAGYICENCYQYQAVPNTGKCNWYTRPDAGCGQGK